MEKDNPGIKHAIQARPVPQLNERYSDYILRLRTWGNYYGEVVHPNISAEDRPFDFRTASRRFEWYSKNEWRCGAVDQNKELATQLAAAVFKTDTVSLDQLKFGYQLIFVYNLWSPRGG